MCWALQHKEHNAGGVIELESKLLELGFIGDSLGKGLLR